jgi:hypothetical protein
MMTAEEAIEYLFLLPRKQRELNFTFDDVDVDPDCDPSGWHGVQITKIFDEFDGLFAIGYWGGGTTVVYDIYGLVANSDDEQYVKKFCVEKLQEYMDNNLDSGLPIKCESICVELLE